MKVYARLDGKLASWDALNASSADEARGMVESCIDLPPNTAVLAVIDGGKEVSLGKRVTTLDAKPLP